ncbi:spermidine coumaroyl-CoA acyltransferase-like [Heracleum sosnowskyi]|uniref:Spermidine coumaroyl-CoA acyltransferase-like n=1 Tax=Heracleum sosnowskyi TaxID=360622 RepID=A0AAD8J8B4_9APIA|nr:spermidine coumaroyl-CoA acyltransferase-like [Heracleum sosnowskyi]
MATPLLIHKKDIILVQPANPTPSEVLSLSTIDNEHVHESHFEVVFVYKASSNTNSDPALVIKEALSKVLVHYYPLAGKLKRETDGKLRITCNADGVPFLEAYADCELSSLHYLDVIDSETVKLLSFNCPSESEYGYHPLVLRVTKFSCGGFAITMRYSHSVLDGSGAVQFYKAMAELASGKSEPTVKPVWERERLVGTPCEDFILPLTGKSSFASSPFLPCTNVAHEFFYVTEEAIARLKMSLSRELGKIEIENFTTAEVLGAYVWRSRARALQLSPIGNIIFCMTMGLRGRMDPPLNAGYYGNAVLYSSEVVLTRRDLEEFPLSKVAKLIKDSKKLSTSGIDFVQKMLDKRETMLQNNIKDENPTGASCMALTDWRHIGLLDEVDFGWKGVVNMVPIPWNNFLNLYVLLPPCKINSVTNGNGGLRVLVTLPEAAMAKMKDEMEILNQHGGGHIDIQSKP